MIGTTLNERFTLEKELGRGGMGAVYRATDQVLQRRVAIKILKELGGEEVGRRIRLEAQILARLLHDNIVRLYDFSADGGTFYFIMEEVDGSSLHKRWKKIDLAARMLILAQVADALDYAHHQGVIHRDVKPANVLLTAADQARLSDFGLSMLVGADDDNGVVRGTPHYMSPEQAKGRKLDHRSDIYALGVMVYECATGTPPYQGAPMEVMSQHVNARPDPPRTRNSALSNELEQYILQLLAKSPDRRPGSGREVAAALRELVANNRLLAAGAGPNSINGDDAQALTADGQASADATASLAGPATGSVWSMAPAATAPAPPPPTGSMSRIGSGAARDLIDLVEAEPIALSPDERYLCGHYLAYLLGGSRRRGFLRRRPLDPLNADRARLLLAMAALTTASEGQVGLARVASLLDQRPDIRPALSPIVVLKYLAGRNTPAKRKRFRQLRQLLQQVSTHAAKHMCDPRGTLNPGLMPQSLDDLRRIAPARTEVDDQLVQRWNRVTEIWRGNAEFRDSVLRYATKSAHLDPVSVNLWPEVVYPLIERARWQRHLRSPAEALWDAVCEPLHLPDAGIRMDRAMSQAVPAPVAAKLDISLAVFEDEPSLGEGEPVDPADQDAQRLSIDNRISAASFHDLETDNRPRALVRLATDDPFRKTMGELRDVWREGIAALRNPAAGTKARPMPIGPYRLSVIASIRSRSAGQVAIQGMPNKQVEMLVPPFTTSGNDTKPILAIWLYTNNSLAVTYLDHLRTQRYILWDAATAQQTNCDTAADLNHNLFTRGLEAPDHLDRVLTKGYRPRNPV